MLKTINLAAKVVAVVGAAIVLTAVGMWAATSHTMWTQLESKQRADGEQSIRSLALVFAGRMKDAKVTLDGQRVARIESPSLSAFSDHSIVDDSVSNVGGNATVFSYDPVQNAFIRRTTTVKKENGDRAVGTRLADDSPAQAFVRKGEAYYGPDDPVRPALPHRPPAHLRQGRDSERDPPCGHSDRGLLGVYEDSLQTMALAAGGIALLVCLTAGPIATRACSSRCMPWPRGSRRWLPAIWTARSLIRIATTRSAASPERSKSCATRALARGRSKRRSAGPRTAPPGAAAPSVLRFRIFAKLRRNCSSRSRPRRRECAGGRRTC